MLLVTGNPRQWESHLRIAELSGQKFIRVSDQRRAGDIWFMEYMYKALPYVDGACLSVDVTDAQMLNIIFRCKFLRILDIGLARRLVIAGFQSWIQILRQFGVSMILGKPVDYYLNDILARLAQSFKIPLISLSESPAKGMTLVQTLAEFNPVREVSPEEVSTLLGQMRLPGHVTRYAASASQSFMHHCYGIVEHHLRDLRRAARRTLDQDPLNFHNNLARFFPRPKRLRDFPFGVKFVSSGPRDSRKPTLFWPLSWTPENTNDYYCPGLDIIDYERFVLNTCKGFSGQATILVKDHMNIVGSRNRGFYRSLENIENVVLIDPRIPATQLFGECDAVLVGTGTAGLEAIVHRKPVIRYGHNYWTMPSNSVFVHPRRLLMGDVDLTDVLDSRCSESQWNSRAEIAIGRMLASSVPGNVAYPRLSPEQREIEVAKAIPVLNELFSNPSKLQPVVFPEHFAA